MKRIIFAAMLAAVTSSALAVSVGDIISKCGADSDAYCKGVGYGDPMQECLDANYAKLTADCKIIVDRLRNGERVSLF
jgi:hypothetical protein